MFYDSDISEPNEWEEFRVEPPVVGMIKKAIEDERHDRMKYKMMLTMTKDEKAMKQIEFPYEDEAKHHNIFQNILFELTGQKYEAPVPKVEIYNSFRSAIESSINGELEAVEFYRKIRSMLTNRRMRDLLYDIITDEQEHATRFVYIYSMLK
jgi:rubrerythrin